MINRKECVISIEELPDIGGWLILLHNPRVYYTKEGKIVIYIEQGRER